MNIEEIFKKYRINFDKLLKYGFIKENKTYKYSKEFMNSFRLDITIDSKIDVKIIDLETTEEYTNVFVKNQVLAFANTVREAAEEILIDIRDNCFDQKLFITDQANRICEQIKELYNTKPEFAWEKSPDFGIFRNKKTKKWFALFMNISKDKLDKSEKGEAMVANVKLDENEILELKTKKGYYPAYHMNKKNWITLIMDDTLSDKEIMDKIIESYSYTQNQEWIIPANPKFYDVINCFNDTDIITWKQSSNICVGDIIYLYVASPYSSILYQCEAIEVDIESNYKDDNLTIKKAMKIKLLKKYPKDKWTFDVLNKYGVKSIRGPRSMPKKLSKEINNKEVLS